jgi:hypothetical protein
VDFDGDGNVDVYASATSAARRSFARTAASAVSSAAIIARGSRYSSVIARVGWKPGDATAGWRSAILPAGT